jgi:signal transduction histidine kinase
LITAASNRWTTLDIVERVALAGRGGVAASDFLEGVCGAVAEAFDFDCVAAERYDAGAEEVTEIAVAGTAPNDRAHRRPIAGVPPLVEARDGREVALVLVDDVTSAFVLPLIAGDRCLGFLVGNRVTTPSRLETDGEKLATVGIVAASLLDSALVREEMRERDTLKSEFIALAAHEVRRPLSSIYGISVTLDERDDELSESERATLRSLLAEEARRMLNLVEQLLDLSRFDLAAIRLNPVRLRLRPTIEALIRPLASARPNAVKVAVPPDLEAVVDSAALDRMLSNLIANALRHGAPPVTITASRRDRHLRLAVEDRGDGVPDEFVPRLFDRFARSREGRGGGDGAGLGLTIAQVFARAHGGEIVYEPAVPHGARFEVVLPLRGYRDK